MINLVSDQIDVHCFYDRQRGHIVFQWVIFAQDGAVFKSDWESISGASSVDPHFLREFTLRFNAWSAIKVKDHTATNNYLETYKQAVLRGEVFNPPSYWVDLHKAYIPYCLSKQALTEQLVLTHPSAEFCTVKPKNAKHGEYLFAFCRKRLWSSEDWVAPNVWIQHANSLFPSSGVTNRENEGSRHINADVKREVWRRDNGQCVRCGSRERLEFDHIIPFAKGGSNTARNIELLCEACNRQKGATV